MSVLTLKNNGGSLLRRGILTRMGKGAIDTASPTTFYTNSSGTEAELLNCRILNATASSITVKVWLGDGAVDASLLFPKDIAVPANGSLELVNIEEEIEDGESLMAQAASAGLVLRASGLENINV